MSNDSHEDEQAVRDRVVVPATEEDIDAALAASRAAQEVTDPGEGVAEPDFAITAPSPGRLSLGQVSIQTTAPTTGANRSVMRDAFDRSTGREGMGRFTEMGRFTGGNPRLSVGLGASMGRTLPQITVVDMDDRTFTLAYTPAQARALSAALALIADSCEDD